MIKNFKKYSILENVNYSNSFLESDFFYISKYIKENIKKLSDTIFIVEIGNKIYPIKNFEINKREYFIPNLGRQKINSNKVKQIERFKGVDIQSLKDYGLNYGLEILFFSITDEYYPKTTIADLTKVAEELIFFYSNGFIKKDFEDLQTIKTIRKDIEILYKEKYKIKDSLIEYLWLPQPCYSYLFYFEDIKIDFMTSEYKISETYKEIFYNDKNLDNISIKDKLYKLFGENITKKLNYFK